MTANPIGLDELLKGLRDRKRFILFVGVITCVLSLLYAAFRPPQFKASVLLQVHHQQENSLGSVAGGAEQPVKESLTNEPIAVQISLIRSRFILGPVLQSWAQDLPPSGKHWFSGKQPESESLLINRLRARLDVRDLTGLSENFPNKPAILQLSLTGKNAQETLWLINRIAEVTQKKDAERKSFEAKQTLDFLSQQLRIVQMELKKSEESLNHYRSSGTQIDVKLQTRNLLTRLSDIDKKIESNRLKKSELSQLYTSLHPFMIAINDQQRELYLQRKKIFSEVRKINAMDQAADDLTHDVRVKNNLYLNLLNKIHIQQVITAGIVSDIGILSPATFAEVVLPLKMTTLGVASLLLGMMLGSFWVLLRRMM